MSKISRPPVEQGSGAMVIIGDQPLTYGELAAVWRVSTRQVKRLCRKLKVPIMDLGHCTKRIRPADVDRAEERAATRGIKTRR